MGLPAPVMAAVPVLCCHYTTDFGRGLRIASFLQKAQSDDLEVIMGGEFGWNNPDRDKKIFHVKYLEVPY